MNPNDYQDLLEQLKELLQDYAEVEAQIISHGCGGVVITDMPRGGNYDSTDTLADLIDTKTIIDAEIDALQARIRRSRRELDKYIGEIKNPENRLVMRLKYVNDLSVHQIAEETGKSYWSVIKILKRY